MESPKIHQTLTILYAAFVASVLVYVMVAVFLQITNWKPVMPGQATVLFGIFLLISLANAGLVWKQKVSIFAENAKVEGNFRQFIMSRIIFWFALSEVPAIFGFVFFLLAGSLPGMVALVVISIAAFTIARPSLANLEELERRA